VLGQDTITKKDKVLIVDDEQSIRKTLKQFFEKRGYLTALAENGLEALSLVEKEDFDVILSDIRMKKMDGIEFVRNISKYNSKIPIILITAYPEVNSAIEAVRCGVVEYVVKPFELAELEEKVAKAIKKSRESSEYRAGEKYASEKKAFLAKFSHELRTPLTPIDAYVVLLLKNEFGQIPARQAEVLQKIKNNSKRLRRIADDLILLYALEQASEPLSIKDENIGKLVEDVLKDECLKINEKKNEVRINIFDGIETIKCDAPKIKKVIFNMLENAVKFSPDESIINIIIRKFSFSGVDYSKVSVKDSGNKIIETNKRILFRKFYDMEQLAREDAEKFGNREGLGLGLTLSKVIVEAHGGRIWLEEDAGKDKVGNVFSFILPI